MPRFLNELWKRRVVQFGALYLGVSWVLLQVVATVGETLDLPHWVAQVALVFLGLGFPVLLILAWAREPAGANHTPAAEASAVSLAAPAASERPSADAAPVDGKTSICVLPFANMSDDSKQDYFSDGITEDIITDLSKVSALDVVSRNTAFTFKGRDVRVREVAHELRVSHVLEGSVRKVGGRVRITAQLIDGRNDAHIWAERYDRDLDDIFALQDEISEAIVKALSVRLLPEEKKAIERRGTDHVEAYNLYLMARQKYVASVMGSRQDYEAIVRYCDRATKIDPNYADAWVLMAQSRKVLHSHFDASEDNGLAAAERALAVDAGLADAHAVKATILAEAGRMDEANAEIQTALRLNSESWQANHHAAGIMYDQRRFAEAIPLFEKTAALEEADFGATGMLASSYHAVGDREGVLRAARMTIERCEKALEQDRNNCSAMAMGAATLAGLGESERAREWMNRALLIDPDNFNMRYNFACTLAGHLGDTDGALEMLRPIFANAAAGLLNHAKMDPDFDTIRDDPRFKAMIAEAEARLGAEKQTK